jgi:hypothetical protein
MYRNEFWDIERTRDEIRRAGYFDSPSSDVNVDDEQMADYSLWPPLITVDSPDVSAFGALIFYLRTVYLAYTS